LTSNQVNDRKAQAGEAKRDADQAEAEASRLGRFANFAQLAQTRKASVASLAQSRFDWERYLREVAHVLPAGTWLTGVDASTKPPAGTSASDAATPEGKLEGCARRQADVAKLMVRLRQLHAVDDVTLEESSRGNSSGSSGSSSGSSGEGCGRYYTFKVATVFSLAPVGVAGKDLRVPSSLGGGS
jgi:Tfp pilus assembly protein PilN